MTKDEALKMALEALHGFIPYLPLNDEAQCGRYDKAIASIDNALKNPEQEPVGWAEHGVINWLADKQFNHTSFLYDTPAPQQELVCVCGAVWEGQELLETPLKRKWVGLTDEDISAIAWNFKVDSQVIRLVELEVMERNL